MNATDNSYSKLNGKLTVENFCQFVAFYPAVSSDKVQMSAGGDVEVIEHESNVDVAPLVRNLLRNKMKERPTASEALAFPLFAAAGANLLAKVQEQQRQIELLRQEHLKEEQRAKDDIARGCKALQEHHRELQEKLAKEQANLQHHSKKLQAKNRRQKEAEEELAADCKRVQKEEDDLKRKQAKAEKEQKERSKLLREREKNLRHERERLENEGLLAHPEHWAPRRGPASGADTLRLVKELDPDILSALQEHLQGAGIGDGGRVPKQGERYSRLQLMGAWRVENSVLHSAYKVAQRRVLSCVSRVPLCGNSKARIRKELYASSLKLPWKLEQGCNEVRLLHGTKPGACLCS